MDSKWQQGNAEKSSHIGSQLPVRKSTQGAVLGTTSSQNYPAKYQELVSETIARSVASFGRA